MKAIVRTRYGGPDVLRACDAPRPRLRADDVLVRVVATSVNPVDWKIRRGYLRWVPTIHPRILGFDVAGEVVEVGRDARGQHRVGSAVYGMLDVRRDGACAEFVAASSDALQILPAGLDANRAAAVPLAGITALRALKKHGRIAAGQRVLILGAAGGVGHLAVQIAKVHNAHVTGVCGKANQQFVRELGADEVLAYDAGQLADLEVYDLIFDAAGRYSLAQMSRHLNARASYISTLMQPSTLVGAVPLLGTAVSLLSGGKARHVTSRIVMASADREELAELGAMIERDQLRPIVSRVFPLEELAEAHRLSEGGHVRGKIVVRVGRAAD